VNHPLRIVFMGTAHFAVPSLTAIAQSPAQVVAVLTRPDRPAGRGRHLRPPPVKAAAQSLALPLLQPSRVSSEEGLAELRKSAPDVIFVVAFGEILSDQVLSLPRVAAVNLHASLLPSLRGAAPIQRAILAGVPETGVTAQWMVPELDAGDIILQRALAIGAEEDFGSLHDRLAQLASHLALESLELLQKGCAPRIPQPAEGVTYALPIGKHELVIDWHKEAGEIARTVRAFSPRPGAHTTRDGRLLKVLAVRVDSPKPGKSPTQAIGVPGRTVEISKEGFWVAAGQGRLLALRVQPEGRATMSAADYVKGYRLSVGGQLGQ
jgi:methionyl-tRNA formyltransferase